MMRLRLLPLLSCLLLALPAAGHAQADSSRQLNFSLRPGDRVQLRVWQEKGLTGKFPVDEMGRVTLPMLGVVPVLGRPWPVLRDSLIAEYQRQLRNPSVSLTPLRRVQVLGEVTKPGQYFADPTLSLAGLIALAGGANQVGDLHRVRVVRDGRTIMKSASVENLLMQGTFESNDQIFVDRRPWLERNTQFVASTVLGMASIIVTIISVR